MIRRLLNVRALAALAAVVILVLIGWFWYRGSSLVKIRHVTVAGLSGPDVVKIRNALTDSALTMTTLNLSLGKLRDSVDSYPVVSSLDVQTHGSHSVTIDVVEKIAVALASGRYVDGAGHALPSSTTVNGTLPKLKLPDPSPFASGVIVGGRAHQILTVLAGAPYKFLTQVSSGQYTSTDGVVAQLRNGPKIYFGPPTKIKQKWTAALAVLRSSASSGAAYIDVTDPQRPAAGG